MTKAYFKRKKTTAHPLTRWRFEHGQMSLATLGKQVKVSAPHLSDIENGLKKPSIELAQRLTKVTRLPIRQIAPDLMRVRALLDRLDRPTPAPAPREAPTNA